MFKRMTYILIAVFFLSPFTGHAHVLLENFQNYNEGKLDLGKWFVRAKHSTVHEVYSIREEGENKFLHAHSTGQFAQLFQRTRWDVSKYPYFSWKWRVIEHPKGSNPQTGIDDNAAAVYVVFKKGLFTVRTIKYVWAEQGDIDFVRKEGSDYPQIIIQSGYDNVGKWVIEKRNVFEDYKRFFGKNPKDAVAFGVVTEADTVKVKNAIADYDDFYALSK